MQTDVTTPNIDGPIMLGVVTSPFDLYQTLHNVWYSQQHATGCANGPNYMYHQTMLGVFDIQSCVCLHSA